MSSAWARLTVGAVTERGDTRNGSITEGSELENPRPSAPEDAVRGQPALIRILIADAHDGVRLGLRTALSTADDMAVVGMVTNGPEALRLCRQNEIDVVLMDMRLPDQGSERLIQEIRQVVPRTQVVVLATDLTAEVRRRAVAAGAIGYLPKNVVVDELVRAVREAHSANGSRLPLGIDET